MITNDKNAQKIGGKYVRPVKLSGLSTDVKPTENIANGSKFSEMDTGKVYFFDLASTTWLEWGAEPAAPSDAVEDVQGSV